MHADGPVADTVVLNAAAGLFVAGAVETIADGCLKAREAVASGKPFEVLKKWAACSQQ